MCNVVIIGAGGHAKVIADIVVRNGDRLLGFLDDVKTGEVMEGYSVLGTLASLNGLPENTKLVIGIGDNAVRECIAQSVNGPWYTAIHPSAQIGASVTVGEGSCVMANAVINPNVCIGGHSIINTAAVVEHDCVVGSFVHLSPHSTLCGTVAVGDGVHLGAAATVINNLHICDSCIIGAGAVVIRNLDEAGTYVGVPARKI